MRKSFLLFALTSFLCFVRFAEGQVDPGVPPFSAYDSHEGDTINLMNNNIVLNIPVMSKSGAFALHFSLIGDSFMSVLGPPTPRWFSNFTNNFQVAGFANGYLGGFASAGGSVSATCPGGGSTTKFINYSVKLADGSVHPLPTTDYTDQYGSGQSCLNASFTDTTIDGSGVTVHVTGNVTNWMYNRSGLSINSDANHNWIKDSNGNSVSLSNGGVLTDSLGTTAVTKKYNSNSAFDYIWTDVNGGSPKVAGNTTRITLRSAFGCSGIADYVNTIAGLVSSGFSYPDGTSLSIGYEGTPGHSGYNTGRIGSLTLREGGTVTYSYLGSNNGINCTYQTVPELKRVTSDGATTYTLAYSLISGSNYKATNTVVDNGGNTTVYTFTGFTSTGNASLPTTQVLTQVKHYQGASTLLTTNVYCYNTAFASCSFTGAATATVTLPITKMVVMHQNNGMSNTSAVETHYDGYGNVTYSAQYDFGATTPTRATTTTYGTWNGTNCVSIGNNINDKPCDVLTTQGGNNVAESHFTYDSHGNLTVTSVWKGSSWLGQTTANTYNSNGTANTTYDLANNATSYAYSSSSYTSCGTCTNYPFPTSITKGGLTAYATWNGMGGVKLTDKDASGNVTTYGYVNSSGTADPFWRVSSVTDPLLNVTYTNYTATTFNNTFSFGSSIKNTTVTIDGYGRRINVQTQQAPSSSNYDTSSTSYGWSGNYKTVNTATPCTTTLGSACVTSHTNYHDPLGRLYQAATVSNETVTKTYPQNDVVTTLSPAPAGENNKSTQKEYDGLGRVVKLCQILSSGGSACNQNTGTSSGTLTSYTYSAFAGGTQVQATRGSQTRTKNYDAFGRMTSETNPESGTTTYVYDSDPAVCKTPAFNGDLVRKTDANGNNTCYFYDRLHRLAASGTYNNNVWVAGSCRRFNYDTAANGFFTPTNYQGSNLSGRLVEAETDNCTPYPPTAPITDEWFSYDADGRLTDFYEKTPHSGGWYHTTASYFANGALNTLGGIPGYTTETYGLDGEGRLNTATEGSTAEVSSVTFNAASQPLTIAIGAANKDSDTYTYDPNTGRMSTYTFTVGTTPASMVGRLTWNPNGTLRTLVITDGFNTGGTQTCNFGTSTVAGYDDLGRIVDDDCGSVWAQTFSYDQYNNLTKAGGLTWNPGYNSKNQYSNIGATYDAAGNITYDVTWHHYQWDGYNKVVGIGNPAVCGTSGTCLTYDALGRMVERVVNSTYNEVLYSPVGKTASMSGLTTVNYSYLPLPGGGRLYSTGSTGSNRNYQHKDWLGSVRLESVISSSTISLDRAYAPYGEVYANFGSAGHYNFTGDTQEVVADGATFDTDNRELNSGQGRWLSPDPAGAGWNLYAYPTNPNNGIDPSGLVDINPGWYLGYGAFNSTMSSMNAYAAGFDNWINSTFFNSVPANSTTSTSSGSATSNSGTSTGSSNGVDRILNGISAFAATFGQSAAAAMFQVEGAPGEEAPPESENLDPINPLEPIDPETSRGPWAFNLMNPGPLDEGHAQDFAGGQYSPITVGEGGSSSDTALYRAYGGASGETGKDGTYYMLVPQVGGLQSAIDGAINPNWGAAGMGRPYSNPYSNGISLANTVCVYLPPGTQAYIGPIAYQGGAWVGGGLQVYVPPNQ